MGFCMKTTLLSICAFVALAAPAGAQQQTQFSDAKKQAQQQPAASGTSNAGDTDRAVPNTGASQNTPDHGTNKVPGQSAAAPDASSHMKAHEQKSDADKTSSKEHAEKIERERDHGTEKSAQKKEEHSSAQSSNARAESKNDKISDHEHGSEKPKD